ncbi:MAG: efflux RND transporter permease subunit [Deferrisomatales bacterium]
MFLSDLSIKRPIFATVLMFALVTLGLFSYRRLPVDLWPDVEIPVLVITTPYPGAAPEAVEREVSKRIEEAVNPIAGLKHVVSTSREGVSTVVAEFRLEVAINDAAQEARAKVAAVRGELPAGIDDPVIQKLDFSAVPVISLAVRSATLSPRDLSTLVEKKLQRRLESLPGVGKVDLVGLARREVGVEVDPWRLQALGMGVDEVLAGLGSENVNTPLGRLTRGRSEIPLRVAGKPAEPRDFASLAVAERGGRPVPLGEVAEVVDGVEEPRTLAFIDGEPAIGVDVQKQSGANTVAVVEAVKAAVERLGPELPAGTEVRVVRDGSVFIHEAVEDVQTALVLGGLLTVAIVFCFLNSWRSTVITGLTLPISVMASFIVMHFLGMTLNTMTLMALSLAIGLLIDDAIVVRENIVRHLEAGKSHFAAARDGTAEIGLAVLATTLSIVAVFVPVAFMGGIVGQFFFSFGVTVAFAVLVSLFVSFTLDPMLSSRWPDPDFEGGTGHRRGPVGRALERFNAGFERLAEAYQGAVAWALGHRKTVSLAAGAAFAGGLALFAALPSSFMPGYDKGEFRVVFQATPDASLAETRDRAGAVVAALRTLPEVARCYATVGANDTTVRDAEVYVKLVDRGERTRTQAEVQREVRRRLGQIPGIVSHLAEAGGFGGDKPLEVALRGDDLGLLKTYAARLKDELYRVPGIVDLSTTLEHDQPEVRLAVDRARALDAGLTTRDVVATLSALVGGQAVTTWEDADGDAVDVRVRLPEALRGDPGQVAALRVPVRRTPGGSGSTALVPLGEVLRPELATTPSEIERQDLSRQVVVSANLDGIALGDAVARVREAAARVPMEPGYRVVFAGEAEEMDESFGYMAEALLLAVIFVYLILAAQFESLIDPLAIMLSLPLSLVGMAGMLWLTGDTVSIMSLIGLIMLMGLVTKNAILLVDCAKMLRARGQGRTEALAAAGRTRLRPILMTTLAMVFGMLPLALALGAGAEMRAPMARAVIGGLVTSTVLTLFVVPVVYTLLDDLAAWARRLWAGEARAIPAEQPVRVVRAAALALAAVAGHGLAATAARAAEPQDAAAPRVLTLDEVVRLARERNRDIQAARELRAELEGRYTEERAAALPQVGLTASAARSRDGSEGIPALTATGVRATLSQALFTWGQVGAAIRAAEVGLGTAEDRLRAARQAAERDATAAYYDVLLARELHDLALRVQEQRERHFEEARKKLAAGVATEYDVLAAEVAAENARPEVLRAENRVRLARDNLRFLLALDDPEVDVAGTLDARPAPAPDYAQALAAALARRPELAEARRRVGVSRELVAVARAGDKPRVDFRAGYGWQGLDGGDYQADGPQWSAGVVITWPLFDGLATRGRVAQAKSRETSLRIEERKLADRVALEVREARNRLAEAEGILQALAGTVTQAERLLALSEKGYEYGVKTRLEVDDAQLNLTTARSELARARRDTQVARVTLAYVTGALGEEG